MRRKGSAGKKAEPNLSIREGAPEDREFVAGLAHRVFSIYGEYRQILPQCLGNPLVYTLIAQVGDLPAGFGMLTLEGSRGELLALAVDPEHHGRGIGRRLMTELTREAKTLGLGEITLKTSSDNSVARQLFDSIDFEITGEEQGYYSGGQDATAMVKRL